MNCCTDGTKKQWECYTLFLLLGKTAMHTLAVQSGSKPQALREGNQFISTSITTPICHAETVSELLPDNSFMVVLCKIQTGAPQLLQETRALP